MAIPSEQCGMEAATRIRVYTSGKINTVLLWAVKVLQYLATHGIEIVESNFIFSQVKCSGLCILLAFRIHNIAIKSE
jgi:hypothetical protein